MLIFNEVFITKAYLMRIVESNKIRRLAQELAEEPRQLAALAEQLAAIASRLERKAHQTVLPIPLGIYATGNLTVLEATVRYLVTEKRMRLCEVADVVGRNERSLWHTAHSAERKHPGPLPCDPSLPQVPAAIFRDKRMPALTSLVLYCRDVLEFANKDIARLLARALGTISCVYSLGKRRRGGA